jgi:hypothetical protein
MTLYTSPSGQQTLRDSSGNRILQTCDAPGVLRIECMKAFRETGKMEVNEPDKPNPQDDLGGEWLVHQMPLLIANLKRLKKDAWYLRDLFGIGGTTAHALWAKYDTFNKPIAKESSSQPINLLPKPDEHGRYRLKDGCITVGLTLSRKS